MVGVTLKDVKDITTPGAPLKDSLFIASTNIDTWSSGPADSKPNGESFRTDVEISGKKVPGRERELQAWVDSDPTSTDADTFGDLNGSSKTWDQFAANEQLFGVKATFDESVYTTPLNRDAPDFKERERKANQIAKDIMGTTTNNPHIAEERGLVVDDSGADEEDKYGAVVRGANAYVPPGARRGGPPAPAVSKPEIPKVSVNGPDGTSVTPANVPSPVPANATATPAKQAPADAVPAFREFVSNEKQRLTQKRQALVKNEMDKRMAELVKFSQSFKLNKPIPDDLVPILAKDEDKQKAIREKAEKDAASVQARAIGASTPSIASRGVLAGGKPAGKPNAPMAPSKTITGNLSQTSSSSAVPKVANTNAAASSSTAASAAATKSNELVLATKKVSMVIQTIPPFKGAKAAKPTPPATAQSASNGAVSPAVAAAAANRLNVNAPSFKVKPGASPGPASASPKPKPSEPVTPNPFFGSRPIKKSPPVNIKDDFNPFKHNKVADASQIPAIWPYNGKRYMAMYPAPQHPPVPHAPHMPPPGPTPMPPPSYEEDQAAATAARGGYVYAYPGYYHGQPMMQGMPPPPGFMQGPYMQHMPYPPGMHPQNAMYSPGMAHMPPPGAYMPPPPPGAYPPPNGAGPRPSMPPTPMPSHAHAHYYQQSPQLQHAVPYPMMMPPPQQGGPPVPHPYDGQQPPAQVPMGGHA